MFLGFALFSQEQLNRGYVSINSDQGIDQLMHNFKKANEGKTIPGYRVQIFSGKRQAAFDLKAEVLKLWPSAECEVVYEVPDYKVQIGNYRNKLEAEKALSDIWPFYKSAFYVQTQITLPKLFIEQN